MKISYNWLQKYFKEKLPEPEVIADGIIFHSFEIEDEEKLEDDTIFDIKILPDRAHDCLSHWGIAKEISVIFNMSMKKENPRVLSLGSQRKDPWEGDQVKNISISSLKIQVNNPSCRRYMGRVVKGIKVGPSPEWLRKSLESIGQKSINNIVDATNYVMFDLGNPIHAFDLDKLASPKIIIEKAKDDEKLTLLDGREVVLDSSVLTIRDEKEALVIAGVKGGKKAEIDSETKNIVIEVANFDPVLVRKTAKKFGIFTDSAKRFENEISPTLAPLAMEEVTDLIVKLAGGEAFEVVDFYNGDQEVKTISFSQKYINNILGVNISTEEIDNILNRFDYEYKKEEGNYEMKIPPLRLDMSGPHDIADEIGRIYGYEKVTPVLPRFDDDSWKNYFNNRPLENETWVSMNSVRKYFVEQGYREVMNYTFRNEGDVEIMASASDKNFLRTNLTDGMKKSFELNKLNSPLFDDEEIKIFEIGTVFPKGKEIINVCFMNKKEIKEMSLEDFCKKEFSSNAFVQVLGRGEREPVPDHSQKHTDSNSFKSVQVFKTWSLYPFIVRDIAVWTPEGTKPEKLIQIYKEFGTELLVREPKLFDSFTKPASLEGEKGRTSFAYRLVFQAVDRTLTDEEINKIMSEINQKIVSLGWEVR